MSRDLLLTCAVAALACAEAGVALACAAAAPAAQVAPAPGGLFRSAGASDSAFPRAAEDLSHG